MSIRVKHKVVLQTSLDTAAKRKLFFQDDDSTAEVTTDGFDRQMSSSISVATTASESLSFGDMTDIRGIYLEVDQSCNLRINGSLDNIPLTLPAGVTSGKAKLLMDATITAVVIENLSGAAILTGVYCVWGDPTA